MKQKHAIMILLNLEKDQFYSFKTGPFLGNEDSEVVSGEIENREHSKTSNEITLKKGELDT
ncbi:hypothetical protein BG808_11655 [Listeria monocytogenes]|nr:hypothetical protein [Listeria monocytogenes]